MSVSTNQKPNILTLLLPCGLVGLVWVVTGCTPINDAAQLPAATTPSSTSTPLPTTHFLDEATLRSLLNPNLTWSMATPITSSEALYLTGTYQGKEYRFEPVELAGKSWYAISRPLEEGQALTPSLPWGNEGDKGLLFQEWQLGEEVRVGDLALVPQLASGPTGYVDGYLYSQGTRFQVLTIAHSTVSFDPAVFLNPGEEVVSVFLSGVLDIREVTKAKAY